MFLTTREKVILETLLKSKSGNTLDYFSSQLKVSRRTVQRDLKNVSHTLATFHLSLSKTEQEFQIAGTNANMFKLAQELHQAEALDQTHEEKNWLLLKILAHQQEPYKLSSLATDVGVSVQTASSYLDVLSEWLTPLQVSIERYRGSGIQLVGLEKNKRQALANYLLQHFDEQLVDLLLELEQEQTESIDWFAYIPIATIKHINCFEKRYIADTHYQMAMNSYMRFLIQLAITLHRIESGFVLEAHEPSTRLTDDAYKFAHSFKKQSDVPLSHVEEYEVAVLWQSAVQLNETMGGYDSLLINRLVHQLINRVSDQLNVDLTDDFSLFQGLLAHMPSAIFRFQNNITVYNPLSADIRRQYPLLFMAIEKAIQEELNGHALAIDEMAYIVLHFGSALEMKKEQIDIATLIICPTGIGASKMLATRLKKEVPELTQHAIASMTDMQKLDWNDYDIVLSTVRLQHPPKDYLLVNPLLSIEDVRSVRRYIKEHLPVIMEQKKYLSSTRVVEEKHVPLTEDFSTFIGELDKTLAAVHSLLDDLKVTFDTSGVSYEKILYRMVQANVKMKKTGAVDHIFEQLIWREKQGGLAIPDTNMALYHCRHEQVSELSFAIVQTQQPYHLKGMDAREWPVNNFILMLAPENLSQSELEIVSMISALIIESPQHITVFSSGQEVLIRKQLEQALQKYIINKTQRNDKS